MTQLDIEVLSFIKNRLLGILEAPLDQKPNVGLCMTFDCGRIIYEMANRSSLNRLKINLINDWFDRTCAEWASKEYGTKLDLDDDYFLWVSPEEMEQVQPGFKDEVIEAYRHSSLKEWIISSTRGWMRALYEVTHYKYLWDESHPYGRERIKLTKHVISEIEKLEQAQ